MIFAGYSRFQSASYAANKTPIIPASPVKITGRHQIIVGILQIISGWRIKILETPVEISGTPSIKMQTPNKISGVRAIKSRTLIIISRTLAEIVRRPATITAMLPTFPGARRMEQKRCECQSFFRNSAHAFAASGAFRMAETTQIRFAPAASTASRVWRLMPPMANHGTVACAAAQRT